ncbi:MAG: hypothetical protein NT075_31420 [Chloroflexi bacterium]|nr:hypothetical protein [Chloroflexota bacterium]
MSQSLEHLEQVIGGHAWPYSVGGGAVEIGEHGLRLIKPATSTITYTNAQLDDYQALQRENFRWRPPLTLTVRARFSHPADQLNGTAGFGFWNDPFLMTGTRWPSLPRAIWFFFSAPPSNMPLALDVPGYGWKAATIDAWRAPFFLLAPSAPLAMPLMRIRSLYRQWWPVAQRAIGVSEASIVATMTEWHTYKIVWGATDAHFYVDERLILTAPTPPRGPLGLVIWLDNQAMIVTPWGKFRHTLVASTQEQWLALASVEIIGQI